MLALMQGCPSPVKGAGLKIKIFNKKSCGLVPTRVQIPPPALFANAKSAQKRWRQAPLALFANAK